MVGSETIYLLFHGPMRHTDKSSLSSRAALLEERPLFIVRLPKLMELDLENRCRLAVCSDVFVFLFCCHHNTCESNAMCVISKRFLISIVLDDR